jgi:hypothetical protein
LEIRFGRLLYPAEVIVILQGREPIRIPTKRFTFKEQGKRTEKGRKIQKGAGGEQGVY